MKTDTHDCIFDEEPSFDDLQPYFDEQARRIAVDLERAGNKIHTCQLPPPNTAACFVHGEFPLSSSLP